MSSGDRRSLFTVLSLTLILVVTSGHRAAAHRSVEARLPSPDAAGAVRARPVPSTVRRLPIAGVDLSALPNAPTAVPPTTALGDQRGGTSPDDRPEVLTSPLDARPFSMVGFVWDQRTAPEGVAIQVRVRESSGWSEWQSLSAADGGPDPGSAEGITGRAATEPLFVDSADALQVRADATDGVAPVGLEAILVDPGVSAADAALATTNPFANWIAPYVISRSQWGADENLRTCTPAVTSTMQLAFVHHTDSPNDYAPEQVPAMIRSMYAYHVQGRGWCDIGYNFLVDKYGRLFEGRYGGIDKPVVGAHTAGFNSLSFGVAMIGNMSTSQPSGGMLATTQQVIGWKLAMHDRDPMGEVTVVSGGSPRYPAGTTVTLNVISGHRDTSFTNCPGNNLYAQLGGVRLGVAQWVDHVRHNSIGSLDQARAIPGGMFLSGWTLDPDTDASTYVWIDISGQGFPLATPFPRQDIADAYPGYGPYHGYQAAVPAAPGTYRVCAIAVNVGPGRDMPLGCKTVTVGGSPRGSLDVSTGIAGGIFLSGWALDLDTTASTYVWIDISGHGFPLATPFPRQDIADAYPGYGPYHGYQAAVPAAPGTYRVCAIAVNVGAGRDTPLGCITTTVP